MNFWRRWKARVQKERERLARCQCHGCELHERECPFQENGERYTHGGWGLAVFSYCSACVLWREDLEIDRSWGRGHGAISEWERQAQALPRSQRKALVTDAWNRQSARSQEIVAKTRFREKVEEALQERST